MKRPSKKKARPASARKGGSAAALTHRELISSAKKGDPRSIGRLLSIIEDGGKESRLCLKALPTRKQKSTVIGITGAPGAGKSTLVDKLASQLNSLGERVAVLAIDPSSPFTGGAVLGDRVRMVNSTTREGVFVRSLASRGAQGGLSIHTPEVVQALTSLNFDYVLVETVGVGQAETEIVRTADCVLVVLVPGMGDSVQALKAGIMEIADIFVINKCDYDGADRLEGELKTMLKLGGAHSKHPPIFRTNAVSGEGITSLLGALKKQFCREG